MQNFSLGSLFLATDGGVHWGILVGVSVAVAALGIFLGWVIKSGSFKRKVGDIKTVTDKMLDDAREESKSIKKEAILEAKEQELRLRNEFERECKEKRQELQRLENRLTQKEESLDKKEENLNKRLTVNKLAELCSMSVATVEKTMFKFSRCGALAFFNALKIRHAKEFLAEGKSVKETALLLGFSNQNYFSARFKKATGIYPTAWKKNE